MEEQESFTRSPSHQGVLHTQKQVTGGDQRAKCCVCKHCQHSPSCSWVRKASSETVADTGQGRDAFTDSPAAAQAKAKAGLFASAAAASLAASTGSVFMPASASWDRVPVARKSSICTVQQAQRLHAARLSSVVMPACASWGACVGEAGGLSLMQHAQQLQHRCLPLRRSSCRRP